MEDFFHTLKMFIKTLWLLILYLSKIKNEKEKTRISWMHFLFSLNSPLMMLQKLKNERKNSYSSMISFGTFALIWKEMYVYD